MLGEYLRIPSLKKFPERGGSAGSIIQAVDSCESHFHAAFGKMLRWQLTLATKDDLSPNPPYSRGSNHVLAIPSLPVWPSRYT